MSEVQIVRAHRRLQAARTQKNWSFKGSVAPDWAATNSFRFSHTWSLGIYTPAQHVQVLQQYKDPEARTKEPFKSHVSTIVLHGPTAICPAWGERALAPLPRGAGRGLRQPRVLETAALSSTECWSQVPLVSVGAYWGPFWPYSEPNLC